MVGSVNNSLIPKYSEYPETNSSTIKYVNSKVIPQESLS